MSSPNHQKDIHYKSQAQHQDGESLQLTSRQREISGKLIILGKSMNTKVILREL